jgi:segregation and condensation protein B
MTEEVRVPPVAEEVDAAGVQADAAAVAVTAAAIESLLFVADRPVPLDRLAEAVEVPLPAAREALEHLRRRLTGSGLLLQAVAGGYQLGTRPEHAALVQRFLQREHGESLTRGALETLAVIAYRQPATRGDIEAVRGSRSDWHIERLLERQLIREVGRRPTPGRPVLFGTTDLFLRYFGLNDLSELPAMGDRGVQALLDVVR